MFSTASLTGPSSRVHLLVTDEDGWHKTLCGISVNARYAGMLPQYAERYYSRCKRCQSLYSRYASMFLEEGGDRK